MRTLIGSIGYRHQRDHPIALVQWFQGPASDEQFDRVILVAAVLSRLQARES